MKIITDDDGVEETGEELRIGGPGGDLACGVARPASSSEKGGRIPPGTNRGYLEPESALALLKRPDILSHLDYWKMTIFCGLDEAHYNLVVALSLFGTISERNLSHNNAASQEPFNKIVVGSYSFIV